MGYRITDTDKKTAKIMREAGYEYTAAYIEMFGGDMMNPWFWNGANDKTETFYKKCVEEGHPWNYYVDEPPKDAAL